ncbi:MAG: hypothetical protein WC803_01265 [Sphingomonas sp.]|jgi:hypothetical protein
MNRWRRNLPGMAAIAALLASTGTATARDSLGVFDRWAAFRDPSPLRCYAISAPVRAGDNGQWRPFAAIGSWPGQGARGQFHIRLSLARSHNAQVTLSVGARRFELVASDADAWAQDARTDAAIVAAMRASRSMSVEALSRTGQPFADVYALRGAATAIDAAALGCLRR